ncbi:hypothetical protein A2U01_0091949 [Trifolium medium]|uniref:Uncharacterized protein n=1 Tax=Trifolium medium TaxID=97028 RepID=A0A392UE40_9FABA|nr:hypothetical protein [Trifolium medium]
MRLAWNLPSWAQQPGKNQENRTQHAPGLVPSKLGAEARMFRKC